MTKASNKKYILTIILVGFLCLTSMVLLLTTTNTKAKAATIQPTDYPKLTSEYNEKSELELVLTYNKSLIKRFNIQAMYPNGKTAMYTLSDADNSGVFKFPANALFDMSMHGNYIFSCIGIEHISGGYQSITGVEITYFNDIDSETNIVYVSLSYSANDEILATVSLALNSQLSNLRNVTKSGYTFDGWFYENSFTNAVKSTDTISADITIYAKLTAIEQNGDNEDDGLDMGEIWKDYEPILIWLGIGLGLFLVSGIVIKIIKW